MRKKIKITTKQQRFLSDTITPVGLYLKLRDQFLNSCLLESSDYHGNDNNFSYICLEPIISFIVQDNCICINSENEKETTPIKEKNEVVHQLQELIDSVSIDQPEQVNGFFGYTNYDAIQYFESLSINSQQNANNETADMHYSLFRFIIQIDHFKNELLITENLQEGKDSNIQHIIDLVKSNNHPSYSFKKTGSEESNISDDEFKKMVTQGKKHCQLGDVFQIVLSRQFSQKFKGDEFNVYRALRSVNPSPYLFYFDYGNYKLFGSSPEAQLKINNQKATLNPIAGTFKRTGNDQEDQASAELLSNDPKEKAEHTMLVDLARNDLSRHGKNVTVKTYQETHFYSHVIHLVSEVEAELSTKTKSLQMFADTFPAGTLSGAPKYRAMQLIDQLENQKRGFYGGAIGYFGLDGSVNHAITIRSFLSKNNTLFFQAGAGVVVKSEEEKELQEVNNKLGALKKALILAENI
jgi:anthranilate synthase component 1